MPATIVACHLVGYAETDTPQIDNARSKFKLDERIPEMKENGKAKMDEIRQDARDARGKISEGIDKADRTVEQKAAEAKGTVSGWFGKK